MNGTRQATFGRAALLAFAVSTALADQPGLPTLRYDRRWYPSARKVGTNEMAVGARHDVRWDEVGKLLRSVCTTGNAVIEPRDRFGEVP